MSYFAVDDCSNGVLFEISVEDLAKAIKAAQLKTQADSTQPTKTWLEPMEHSTENQVVVSKGKYAIVSNPSAPTQPHKPAPLNPYSLNQMLERGQTKPLNDMYAERTKKQPEMGENDAGQDPDGLIDLYSERIKRRKWP